MALDSTGAHPRRLIPCFICEVTRLQYTAYIPEWGHGGEKLDVGSCMAPHDREIKNLAGAKFFELHPGSKDLLVPQEAELRISGEPYHYRGYREPDFGDRPHQVVFICRRCVELHEGTLEVRIINIAERRLDLQYLGVLSICFAGGLFLLEKDQLRKRWRRMTLEDRKTLKRRMASFIQDLETLEPTKKIRSVLAKCRRIEKLFTA